MRGALRLSIVFGNEQMSEPDQAAAALRKVADQIDAGREEARILDANGQTVGLWEIEADVEG